MSRAAEPILLTPGPLTTSAAVKQAMLRDWGSRDPDFEALTRFVLAELLGIANAGSGHVAVPIQGSGTYAVEAMIGTLARRDGRMLVLTNGAYGQRMIAIARGVGLDVTDYAVPETQVHDPAELRRRLAADPSIRSVGVVHCETTSGILNPVESFADIVGEAGRDLYVDSMSAFGAIPVDARRLRFAGLAASANKCLQGVPGIAFVICPEDRLAEAKGRSPSLVLDLEAQHRQLLADGQWRFTPPTHIVAALAEAIRELAAEGGPAARLARYRKNSRILIEGMRGLGFDSLLADEVQSPIIASFAEPAADWFAFPAFYERLKTMGFAIYAGKMKVGGTFRVGSIGAVDPNTMTDFVACVERTVAAMKEGR
ncbi:MAG: 2-aminoethylphosphonate--pyruvate transaminase [Rhizobiaceae bacterium]